jgi:hypothetical protein
MASVVFRDGDPAGSARPLAGPGRWLALVPFVAITLVGIGLALASPTYDRTGVLLAGALMAVIVLAVAVLPWARWPANWQAAPVLALYGVAALLEYAAGEHATFIFLTALPVIWLVLYHTRQALVVGLTLLAAVLFLPPLVVPGYPRHWSDLTMTFVLSCFGGLAGQYLVSRARRAAIEARAATHRARADHDLLNAYLDSAGSLVMVADRSCRVTLFNRHAEQVTGYRADQVVGELVWQADLRAQFGEVLAGRGPVRYEADTVIQTGERRRIGWNMTGLADGTGQASHVIAIGADITEKRATERLFAKVLAAATNQLIAAIDTNRIFTVFNAGAERMLGYQAAEMIGRRRAEDIHVPEELAALAAEAGFPDFQEMVAHPPPVDLLIDDEWTLVRKDGSRFPARMTVNTMRDGGELVGFVLVAHDITAERQAMAATEQALERERAAADRLRELDQVKSDFVATVSHDLRTPLTSIVGNTELILDGDAGDLAPMQRRLLETVDRNARRLDTLVGDLLLLSRIESGTLRLHPRDVSVKEVVDGALEALTAQRAADVQLDVSVPAEPVLVRGDPDQLERVTTNLVGNALKFTPPGGRVEVGISCDPTHVQLRISDTGIGIPPDELPHIFDRFFRSSRSQAKQRPGTGLGLTIAKSIVEQHGGTIQASANPSGGTTFVITLPRLVTAADPSEKEPA